MSMIATILTGQKPTITGHATIFLAEEYRDRPKKKREEKVYVNPEHSMIQAERINRSKVFSEIKRKPSTSTDLVERTKLSRTAIHNLTRTLIEEGKVRLNKDVWPWIYMPIKKREAA
jgi:hypothetical protein